MPVSAMILACEFHQPRSAEEEIISCHMSGKWKAKGMNTILAAFELIMSVYLHVSDKRDTAASRTIPLVSH